jgi:hypothetical protein
MKHTYSLDIIHDQFAEAVGGEDITITVGGKEFTFPHPVFTPGDVKDAVNAATKDEAIAALLLGDQYEAFLKAGGRPIDVSLLYGSLAAASGDEIRGVKPRPIQS